MCNATRGIEAGCGVIRHRGVSDGSDAARPLWRSYSALTEMFSADVTWHQSGLGEISCLRMLLVRLEILATTVMDVSFLRS